jgi:hypothetical protein
MTKLIAENLEEGNGIFRLAPSWVPRDFLSPGGRLKLVPQDIYALGVNRGGIDERWLASTTRADNPGSSNNEGLSYIIIKEKKKLEKILFKDAIAEFGIEILGKEVIRKYNGWKVLAKFFDNEGPIPHHLHQMEKHARKINKESKPESYYFPLQLNLNKGRFPYTFFGLNSDVKREDVKKCLERWNKGDNSILNLSKAYKLEVETGWLIQAGILHAPGTMLTYEVQRASDVFSMFQSMVDGKPVPWDLLVKDVPKEKQKNLNYIIDMIDWDANLDPKFKRNHFLKPKSSKDSESNKKAGYKENWIIYGTKEFSAKELTVYPKSKVVIVDSAAYGLIVIQGRGKIGRYSVESPVIVHYNDLPLDELFVTFEKAKEGVEVSNESSQENLVVLKHFGPGNPAAPINLS